MMYLVAAYGALVLSMCGGLLVGGGVVYVMTRIARKRGIKQMHKNRRTK